MDNYLNLTPGHNVPLGYYHRAKGHWVAEHDGLVLKILDIVDGKALLDLDGDGLEDDGAYGDADVQITTEERYQLAQLYSIGDELMRVRMNHFTMGDLNLGFSRGKECPPGNKPCDLPPPKTAAHKDCSQTVSGSIIECQNQVLGERIPIKGTPYSLHYQSDRTPGFKAAYHLDIPVTGNYDVTDTNHAEDIEQILVEVDVAGTRNRLPPIECKDVSNPCSVPNLVESWDWDPPVDAWGRTVQGPQQATVRVGYTFGRDYADIGLSIPGATNESGQNLLDFLAAEDFASWPDTALFSAEGGSKDWHKYAVWTEYHVGIGAWSNLPLGLGGLSVDVHHAYSPALHTLFLGDGRRRTVSGSSGTIDYFAGGGSGLGSEDDGKDALAASINVSHGFDFTADGTLYFPFTSSYTYNHMLRRIDPADGKIYNVTAPTNSITTCASDGDFSAPINAHLCNPDDVSVGPDGSLYVAETGKASFNHGFKIRRIDFDAGTISTIAGTGTPGYSGDDGDATAATLNHPSRVAAAPDGRVFFVDQRLSRPRRGPSGRHRRHDPSGSLRRHRRLLRPMRRARARSRQQHRRHRHPGGPGRQLVHHPPQRRRPHRARRQGRAFRRPLPHAGHLGRWRPGPGRLSRLPLLAEPGAGRLALRRSEGRRCGQRLDAGRAAHRSGRHHLYGRGCQHRLLRL